MELSFGTNVLEHGYSIGRLAGIEADRQTRLVRNIIASANGSVDVDAEKRPLVDVPADHFDGDIVLRGFPATGEALAPDEVLLLAETTRVIRAGRQIGRLAGVEVSPETGEIVAIFARHHWWTRRFRLEAPGLDFSVPGEIRVGAATARAA
ncbi:MAG: hypothetical protein HY654_07830 [Acidobacteria bacterium]|nr:hypothetical protein [Acidobacteriota bacterium]